LFEEGGMKLTSTRQGLIVGLMLLFPLAGNAYITNWALEDAVLFGGTPIAANVTGTFSYDTETKEYINVQINSDAGFWLSCPEGSVCPDPDPWDVIPFQGGAYDASFNQEANGFPNTVNFFNLLETSDSDGPLGAPTLNMTFEEELTSTSGIVGLANYAEVRCSNAICTSFDAFRIPLQMEGFVRAVPEPDTLGLLGLGLLGLALVRRKVKAA
jgi:PEP-CTERM motif-containing protein